MTQTVRTHELVSSAKVHPANLAATHIKPVDPDTKLTFSVFAPVRQKALDSYVKTQLKSIAKGDLFGGRIEGTTELSKQEWARRFGATKTAMKKAADVLRQFGIEIVESNSHTGEIVCRALLRDIQKLIPNLVLDVVDIDGSQFHMRHGAYEIAAPKDVIIKIQGLDTIPLARNHYKLNPEDAIRAAVAHVAPRYSKETNEAFEPFIQRVIDKLSAEKPAPRADAGAFTPFDLVPIFKAPDNDGLGQTIGIIALGGGYNLQDGVDFARNVLKIRGDLKIKVKPIDGATNTPDPGGSDIETVVDVVGALGAPGATIWIVIAPNTSLAFAHGIGVLIDLGCDIITISWGSDEANWTQQGIDTMHTEFARAFATGVTVYAAAGDNDSPDGDTNGKVNGDYPATDPLVISMIGLWLSLDGKTAHIWNTGDSGSGGGVSDVFAQQEWEKVGPQVASLNDGVVRHWVGGLAGPADPATGVTVSYQGRLFPVGGTSIDGPLYAGMTARLNKALGRRVGFYLPYVVANYATDNQLVFPVTEGDNAPTGGKGYTAQQLTVGMLNFGRLLERLQQAA